MKIIFTKSGNPNLGTKLIAAHQRSPWTHVVEETDIQTPDGEAIVLHSHWRTGLSLDLKSLIVGGMETKCYEDGLSFDWDLVREMMRDLRGFQHYGWSQILGTALRFFYIPEPKWLLKRYSKEAHCAGYVIRRNQKRGLMKELDPYRTGPGKLERYMAENENFEEVALI